MNDEEQIERERKAIGFLIATFFGGGAITLLVCGGILVALALETGESSPDEAKRWFQTVVAADPSAFSDIRHFTDQGIDFSHHFRFRFSDIDDVAVLAQQHGLTLDPSAGLLDLPQLPAWYDPESVTAGAQRYSIGGSEPLILIVDPERKIAYFEMVHL